jgi:magnesium chelatase family protein
MQANGSEASAVVRARVVAAREIQRARYARLPDVHANAQAPMRALHGAPGATPEALRWLVRAADQLRLSARGYARVLRVARTIADLDGAGRVEQHAMAEALRFRGEG